MTPTVDYASVIRAELERTVAELKQKMEGRRWDAVNMPDTANERVTAQYVEVGYLIGLHKGHRVFQSGELIAGLPVRIAGTWDAPGAIRVCADKVPSIDYGEDGDEEYEKDVVEETVW